MCAPVFEPKADPVRMTAIIVGSGNAEMFRHGIHWSNDRSLLCKKCNSHKNIHFTCAKCFLWWSTLNEPPNLCVQDIIYDYNTNKSVVFKSSNEKGQYWPPLKLEGTPCFHATPSCHVFTRGRSIDLDYKKNKALWVCRSQPLVPSVRRVVTFRARMDKYISGNRLSIDSYGHVDRCSLIMRL